MTTVQGWFDKHTLIESEHRDIANRLNRILRSIDSNHKDIELYKGMLCYEDVLDSIEMVCDGLCDRISSIENNINYLERKLSDD